MLGNFPPFTTMQELNLDWILNKIKNILRFVPDDGAVGQILRRTAHGAEWSDEQGAGGSVTSVNGMQGAVVLDAADVGALPDTTVIPTNTSDLNNDNGFVDAAGAAAAAPVQSVNGQTGTVSLDASDVGALPDTYVAPVTSVNGQTGSVSITIPDSTSDLLNDSGFVDAAGASAAAPVQSVNGQTGAVNVAPEIVYSYVDAYTDLKVMKLATFYHVILARYTTVASGTLIINIGAQYAPSSAKNAFAFYGTSLSQAQLDTNGNVTLYSGDGNPTAGVYDFYYYVS